MPYLLRVELPDVPGSLGRVASAIGEAGGDIDAIEIVEHRRDGYAVDDVLLDIPQGVMPDTIISACNVLDGVHVLWISRYAAGGQLFLDLEAVEEMTQQPDQSLDKLVDLLPVTFKVDWAARVARAASAESGTEIVHATGAAPETIEWAHLEHADRVHSDGEDIVLQAGAPVTAGEIVLIGRRGGPDFLDSEVARLGHLVGLAVTISRTGD